MLEYDQNAIRIWDSPEKTNLYRAGTGEFGNCGDSSDQFPGMPGIEYTGQETVWVEGISLNRATIHLIWVPNQVGGCGGDENNEELLGEIAVIVWGIDVDIDSDNDNGFNFPEGDEWEEYLEDSPYGLGKFLQTTDTHFTPVRIRLPRGLDPNAINVGLQFDFTPAGESGVIFVWNTFEADPLRNNSSTSVLGGGNRIYPGETYSLQQINYDPVGGGAIIYVDAFLVHSNHYSKKGVVDHGKPDDRITGNLIVNGLEQGEDEVKYMVVEANSFYTNLQGRSELRSAMASEGVYAQVDMPEYALKLLNDTDLQELGVPWWIRQLIGEPASIPGLSSAVYLDHVSGNYILSFAGTNDYQDVLVDIWQGLGGYTEQYQAAMEIGFNLFDVIVSQNRLPLITTGHSLGGGLASAAAVVTGIHADTFNSAGLLESTLWARDAEGNRIPGVEQFPGSLQRRLGAAALIDAYYLDWDILSFVQDYSPAQDALGVRHKMDGPVDERMIGVALTSLAASLVPGPFWAHVLTTLGHAGYLMGMCHTTLYYQYGLMVDESTGWDIYGYEF